MGMVWLLGAELCGAANSTHNICRMLALIHQIVMAGFNPATYRPSVGERK
jgi:hypothetical protein